jgi:hypothetical protein
VDLICFTLLKRINPLAGHRQTLSFNEQYLTGILAASNSQYLLESALVCPDNNAKLAGEEIGRDVSECLEIFLSDQRETERCKFADI